MSLFQQICIAAYHVSENDLYLLEWPPNKQPFIILHKFQTCLDRNKRQPVSGLLGKEDRESGIWDRGSRIKLIKNKAVTEELQK